MCGILGFINTPWQDDLDAALASLAPRGPDDSGRTDQPPAVLLHRRLSVIDLAGGHQPMSTADGRYTLVFNGEIYNFVELRQELSDHGFDFTTRSDSEVLLHGFVKWGADLPRRLDGMFAFAVWDRDSQQLFAARDPVGIKPFFYSTHRGFGFASTLAPFFHLDGFPRALNFEALRDYLACQTVMAPHSFLRDVRQLPPAHWLRYDARSDRLTVEGYWNIPAPEPVADSVPDLVDRIDAVLAHSVRRQLVADVPLGAFLSGGIDSSLMVHYMAAAGADPLQTFSVRFAQERYDESPMARSVATQFGAEHHVLDAPQINADLLRQAVDALDQPLADPAYIPTHHLARLTRQHVTVAVSGDGGDELFGGYARFFDVAADHPPARWRAALRRMIEGGVLPGALWRRSLSGRDLLFYRRVELGPWPVSRKSLRRYLVPGAWEQCHEERTLERWVQLIEQGGGDYDTDSLLRADLWTYLSENCLAKTDRASMAHGLEVRVPLLGREVLDTILSLPARLHRGPSHKALLRELARRHLPATVWDRPKHGFSMPLADFFAGSWSALGDDLVARSASLAPFLEARAVQQLWQRAKAGNGSNRLAYTFLVLLLWLERHRFSE